MKDVAPAQINVCTGQVDFHVQVVRCVGRIDVNDRLVVCAVNEPADAVGIYFTGGVDEALHRVRASDCRQVEVIGIMCEIRDRIESSGARL